MLNKTYCSSLNLRDIPNCVKTWATTINYVNHIFVDLEVTRDILLDPVTQVVVPTC